MSFALQKYDPEQKQILDRYYYRMICEKKLQKPFSTKHPVMNGVSLVHLQMYTDLEIEVYHLITVLTQLLIQIRESGGVSGNREKFFDVENLHGFLERNFPKRYLAIKSLIQKINSPDNWVQSITIDDVLVPYSLEDSADTMIDVASLLYCFESAYTYGSDKRTHKLLPVFVEEIRNIALKIQETTQTDCPRSVWAGLTVKYDTNIFCSPKNFV